MSEQFPLELTNSPDNAHTFWCEFQEQRRHIRCCRYLMDRLEQGQLKIDEFDTRSCLMGLSNKTCQAYDMLKQEQEAGHALFYEKRLGTLERPHAPTKQEVVKETDDYKDSYARGWNRVGSHQGTTDKNLQVKKRPSIPVVSQSSFTNIDYSRLVEETLNQKTISKKDFMEQLLKAKELLESGQREPAKALYQKLSHYKEKGLIV